VTFLAAGPVFPIQDGEIGWCWKRPSDAANGGGHVPAVIISTKAKQGYQSTTLYQHQSLLRLILEGPRVSNLPAASSTAPDMGEFF